MDTVIFVEILDHRGRPKWRHRFERSPILVGRSYENDVIVDDTSVCPKHGQIVVDESGAIWFEDLGSVNGSYRAKKAQRESRFTVAPGAKLRVGRTLLRVCTPAMAVPQTVSEGAWWTRFAGVRDRAVPAIGTVLGVTALIAAGEAISSTEPSWGVEFFGAGVGMLVALALWAGIWALTARLRGRPPRFLQHAAWTAVFGLLIWMSSIAFSYFRFAVPRASGLGVIEGVIGLAFFVVLLAGHMSLAGALRPKWRIPVAAFIPISFGLLVFMIPDDPDLGFDNLNVAVALRPVPTGLLATTSPESFFERANELKEELDATGADSTLVEQP